MAFLRKIWAIYAVILFIAMMFFSIPIVLFTMIIIPGKRALRSNIFYLHHFFTPIFLTLVGIRLKVEGRKNLDRKTSYVIVSNHNSALDFILNGHAFPGVFRFLAKQELHKVPVFGWIVKKMCVAVDRTSAMSRARSIIALKQELAEGMSIFIYPEGGRNRTNEPLAPFFDGAFRIAVQTGVPIAIQTITNIKNVTATALSVDLRPGTVKIIWDKPMPTKGLKGEEIEQLKKDVEAIFLSHLSSAAS